MTYYWVGDIPTKVVIDPARNGENIDLEPFDGIDITLVSPTGALVESVELGDGALGGGALGGGGVLGTAVPEGIELDWPFSSLLTTPGLWQLRVWLTNGAGRRERIEPAWIIVQDEDGWQTLDSARADWREARTFSDLKLWRLLAIAKLQITEYAPDLAPNAPIPVHYSEAQRMQAQNIWNAGRVDPSGGVGGDDFTIRPFALDWHIKQMLRPRGIPMVR